VTERIIDKELNDLKIEILRMGSMVEKAIARSMQALKDRNTGLARVTIEFDARIDEVEIKIYELCIQLLARYQPEAGDLRFITMAMLINNDLERMGDLAVNICERVLELADKPLVKPLIDLPALTELTRSMVAGSLQAFTQQNSALARAIRARDDEVDRRRDAVQAELVKIVKSKPETVDHAIPLLLVARHLERICDHAANIAEDVVYMVEASMVRHKK
jgi:phosphate transport system protein